jgi:hypothetical protein
VNYKPGMVFRLSNRLSFIRMLIVRIELDRYWVSNLTHRRTYVQLRAEFELKESELAAYELISEVLCDV